MRVQILYEGTRHGYKDMRHGCKGTRYGCKGTRHRHKEHDSTGRCKDMRPGNEDVLHLLAPMFCTLTSFAPKEPLQEKLLKIAEYCSDMSQKFSVEQTNKSNMALDQTL